MTAPQILIVDDDTSTQGVLSAALSRAGYGVRCAADGRKALASRHASVADIVITDIFMPQMDGIELILALRADADTPKIIAISGDGALCARDALRMAELLGADAIFEKPLSMPAIVEAVSRLLAGRGVECLPVSELPPGQLDDALPCEVGEPAAPQSVHRDLDARRAQRRGGSRKEPARGPSSVAA